MSCSWMCCYRIEGIEMSYCTCVGVDGDMELLIAISSYSVLGPKWLALDLESTDVP